MKECVSECKDVSWGISNFYALKKDVKDKINLLQYLIWQYTNILEEAYSAYEDYDEYCQLEMLEGIKKVECLREILMYYKDYCYGGMHLAYLVDSDKINMAIELLKENGALLMKLKSDTPKKDVIKAETDKTVCSLILQAITFYLKETTGKDASTFLL